MALSIVSSTDTFLLKLAGFVALIGGGVNGDGGVVGFDSKPSRVAELKGGSPNVEEEIAVSPIFAENCCYDCCSKGRLSHLSSIKLQAAFLKMVSLGT